MAVHARLTLALILLAVIVMATAISEEYTRVNASEVLAKITAGEPVEYDHVIVDGNLDLRQLNSQINITSPIRINNSIFNEFVYFNDMNFDESIDLSKSNFTKTARFCRAKFNEDVRFDGATFNKFVDFGHGVLLKEDTEEISGSTFNEEANFSNAIFEEDVRFSDSTFNKMVDFQGSIFKGDATFNKVDLKEGIDFGKATFNKSADFQDATFSGSAYFKKATFNAKSDFSKAIFGDEAIFNKILFNDDVNFEEAIFKGYAGFGEGGISFIDEEGFNPTIFNGDADFNKVTFNGDADFMNITFQEGAYFREASFLGDADFRKTMFNLARYLGGGGRPNFSGASFKGDADFEEAVFRGSPSFRQATFNKDIDFNKASFSKAADLTEASFRGYLIGWEEIKSVLKCDEATYLGLIKNFKDHGQFNEADDCFFIYRYYNMRGISDFIGWISCGFGVRWLQTIYFGIFWLLFFALAYYYGMVPRSSLLNRETIVRESLNAIWFSAMVLFSVPSELYPKKRDIYTRYMTNIKYNLPIFERLIGWGVLILLINTLSRVMLHL